MPTLAPEEIGRLLLPFLPSPSGPLLAQLGLYLDLLVKWNARTNLTAVRDPEEIVTRHFGESLFAAQHVGTPDSLLDFGSGAGFPGIPIALLRPEIDVTLAESQHKKASFLREAVRFLGLRTEVWAARVEDLPLGGLFDSVTLRAVDDMGRAGLEAERRAARSIICLTTVGAPEGSRPRKGFSCTKTVPVPMSAERILVVFSRV